MVAQGHVVGVRLVTEVTSVKKKKKRFTSVMRQYLTFASKKEINSRKRYNTNKIIETYLKSPVLCVSLWLSKELACL